MAINDFEYSALIDLISNEFFGESDSRFLSNVRTGCITALEHKAMIQILDRVSGSIQDLYSALSLSSHGVTASLPKTYDVVSAVNNISSSLSVKQKVQVASSCVQIFNASSRMEAQFTVKYQSLYCFKEELEDLKHRIQATYAPFYDDTYRFSVSFKIEPVLFYAS